MNLHDAKKIEIEFIADRFNFATNLMNYVIFENFSYDG